MEENVGELLTEEEVETLILSLGTAQETFTEEDVELVIEWAEKVRIDMALLGNVLKGLALISVKDGEVYFQISDKGKQYIESVIGKDDYVLDSALIN